MTDLPPPVHDAETQAHILSLESQLVRQQDALSLFYEAPAAYVLLDPLGQIEDLSAVACQMLDQVREAVLGQPLSALVAPGSREVLATLLAQAGESGLRERGELRLLGRAGAELEVLMDLDAERDGDRVRRYRLVLTDVTAHHAGVAEAGERQTREHAQRVRELNQELEGVVTTLIRGLQRPVARAISFLSLARRQSAELRPVAQAEEAVQQVNALLASVERYILQRSMRAQLRPVNLNSVMAEVVRRAQPLMADRTVHLTHDPLPTVQGDSQALFVILDEYVGNALKFSKRREEARVHVLARDAGTEHHIGVRDNGTGFDMVQAGRLFQLFSRLHSSRHFEGTGVGLLTVRRACERFGGRVWAEAEVDQGATFWFAWPKEPRVQE